VRNRLTGLFYAIKKVMLDPKEPKMVKEIIKEVTTLARLEHSRIVRYYSVRSISTSSSVLARK
jgi:hypothetical protein